MRGLFEAVWELSICSASRSTQGGFWVAHDSTHYTSVSWQQCFFSWMKKHTGNQTPQDIGTGAQPEVRGRSQQEATMMEKPKCLLSWAANTVHKGGKKGKEREGRGKGKGEGGKENKRKERRGALWTLPHWLINRAVWTMGPGSPGDTIALNLSGIAILAAPRATLPDLRLVKLNISKKKLKEQFFNPFISTDVSVPEEGSQLPHWAHCAVHQGLRDVRLRKPFPQQAPSMAPAVTLSFSLSLCPWEGARRNSHLTDEETDIQHPVHEHLERAEHQNPHPAWGLRRWVCSVTHGCLSPLVWPLIGSRSHPHCQRWFSSVLWAAPFFYYSHYRLSRRGVTLPASGEL